MSRRRRTSTARCSRRRRSPAAANKLAGQAHVYFSPKQLNVVKFNAAGTKYTVLWATRR